MATKQNKIKPKNKFPIIYLFIICAVIFSAILITSDYKDIFGGLVASLIFGAYIYLFISILLKDVEPPTEKEIEFYNHLKSKPPVLIKARPNIFMRLVSYLFVLPLSLGLLVLYAVSIVVSPYFALFLSIPLIILFISIGRIFISIVLFDTEGLRLYTKIQYYLRIGNGFFIPYDKCRVGYLDGGWRGDNLVFIKDKFTYASLMSKFWGSSWQDLVDELRNRLPESKL